MEAKLEEVALCRQQEPREQGRSSSDWKNAADTAQSPGLCQSNQSSGQPLPPDSVPTLVPVADRSWVPKMKSSVLVPGKGRAGGSQRITPWAQALSAFSRLAPQVAKPKAYLGSAHCGGGGGGWEGGGPGGQGPGEERLHIVSKSGRENECLAEMSGMGEFVGLLQILSG